MSETRRERYFNRTLLAAAGLILSIAAGCSANNDGNPVDTTSGCTDITLEELVEYRIHTTDYESMSITELENQHNKNLDLAYKIANKLFERHEKSGEIVTNGKYAKITYKLKGNSIYVSLISNAETSVGCIAYTIKYTLNPEGLTNISFIVSDNSPLENNLEPKTVRFEAYTASAIAGALISSFGPRNDLGT